MWPGAQRAPLIQHAHCAVQNAYPVSQNRPGAHADQRPRRRVRAHLVRCCATHEHSRSPTLACQLGAALRDASNTTVCQLATLQAGGDAPVFCALPDLPIVAVCANGQLQLYTINDDCGGQFIPQLKFDVSRDVERATALALTADGTFAALADPCGRIARIDLATGTATAIDVASDGSVIALCMVKFEQGAHVAALCNSSAAVLWPLEGAVPPVVVRPKTPSDGVAIIGLNGDGRLCDKDQVRTLNQTTGAQVCGPTACDHC